MNFFCDNIREFRRLPDEFGAFDLHWVPEKAALPMYARRGWSALHAPMPCWVVPSHRHGEPAEEFGPTFIGSHDDVRARLLGEAIARGAPLTLRGAGWTGIQPPGSHSDAAARSILSNQKTFIAKHGVAGWCRKLVSRCFPPTPPPDIPYAAIAPPVSSEDYVSVTRKATVVIGVNRFQSFRQPLDRPGTYSRLRDIEAPMLGTCYLTEWAEGLDDLFIPGEEIELYRSAGELVEKIHRLQAEHTHRRRLRAAAQRRALEEHSIPATIGRLCRRLDLAA